MPRKPTAPPPTLRVAHYCRVSTEDQAERQTIDAQTDFLRRYCELHDLPVAGVYVDDGVSGTLPLAERPAGKRLLDDARDGRFGCVLVYRLDRLGRNLRALLDAHDRLSGSGIAIRSTTEPFDTATPIGQFLFQLLGSLAELEKATIVERTTMGRDRVARLGKWTNGSVAVGYDVDADGILVESTRPFPHGQTEADTVRDLFVRIADGATLTGEARRLEGLGVPSIHRWPNRADRVQPRWWPSRIHKIISNPIYKGRYVLDGRNGPIPVPVPALVDDALWDRAQAAMTRNRDLSSVPYARAYLLRGIARCRTILETGAACGRTYNGGPGSKRLEDGGQRLYYHCSGARNHAQAPDRARCHGRSVPMHLLDRRVWEDVRAFVLDPGPILADARAALDVRSEDTGSHADERTRLGQALANRAAERERAQLLFTRGLAAFDETERRIVAIDRQIAEDRALLDALDVDRAAVTATAEHLGEVALLVSGLLPLVEAGDAGDMQARRQVIELLVREVAITTELSPPTGRQKRDQKHVRVVVRYRHSPLTSGPAMYGSIPSALANGILPYIGGLSIEREVSLVR